MTPPEVYKACEEAWGRPDLDPCWCPQSPVRPHVAFHQHGIFATLGVEAHEVDGLSADWRLCSTPRGWVWLNPPYSKPGPWLEKAVDSNLPVVALLKCDPSTRWWNDWVWEEARCVGFFRKRLRFGGTVSGAATFPSALCFFGPYYPGTAFPDLPCKWTWP